MANFCSSCGTATNSGASFCASCGNALASASAQTAPIAPQQAYAYVRPGKSKTTAVVLAVFLGYWSWLYTFQRDKAKFFVGLGVGIVVWIANIATFLANSAIEDKMVNCYSSYIQGYIDDSSICDIYKANYTPIYVFALVGLGMWIWSLVDQSRKSQGYYTNFPNQNI